MPDELPFKIVRSDGTDELLARAVNLLIARGAYRSAARMYPEDLIDCQIAPSTERRWLVLTGYDGQAAAHLQEHVDALRTRRPFYASRSRDRTTLRWRGLDRSHA
jgi:hypothetical protein